MGTGDSNKSLEWDPSADLCSTRKDDSDLQAEEEGAGQGRVQPQEQVGGISS